MANVNFITRPPIKWTLLILGYLSVEWIYNQHLLLLLSLPNITTSQLQISEWFGKTIASFGLSLVVIRLMQKPTLLKFTLSWATFYALLCGVFSVAIEVVPDTFRHASFYSVMQREQTLLRTDTHQALTPTQHEPWFVAPLLLSQFFVTIPKQEWKSIEKDLKEPLLKQVKDMEKNKENLWRKYIELQFKQQQIIAGWNRYQQGMKKYNKYKNTRFEARARQKFEKAANLPVDLTYESFVMSVAPDFERAMGKVLVPGRERFEVTPILVKDVPHSLNKSAFFDFLENNAGRALNQIAPDVKSIRQNTLSHNAVSLLIIPPLSIALSLISIGINILALSVSWITWATRSTKAGYVAGVLLVAATVVNFVNTKSVSSISTYWQEQHIQFQQSYPVTSLLASVPMRAQSWISPQEEPTAIRHAMTWLYAHLKN